VRSEKPMDEDDFIWEMFITLFSVALSFSIYNAFIAGIFIPGDLIYAFAGLKQIDQRRIATTLIYPVLLAINVLSVAYIWKHKWFEKMKHFYLKTLLAFLLGTLTPMLLYYIMWGFSKYILGIPGL